MIMMIIVMMTHIQLTDGVIEWTLHLARRVAHSRHWTHAHWWSWNVTFSSASSATYPKSAKLAEVLYESKIKPLYKLRRPLSRFVTRAKSAGGQQTLQWCREKLFSHNIFCRRILSVWPPTFLTTSNVKGDLITLYENTTYNYYRGLPLKTPKTYSTNLYLSGGHDAHAHIRAGLKIASRVELIAYRVPLDTQYVILETTYGH